MRKLIYPVRNFVVREAGATMMEYGLMIALIALICLASVTIIGTSISGFFSQAQPSI